MEFFVSRFDYVRSTIGYVHSLKTNTARIDSVFKFKEDEENKRNIRDFITSFSQA